MSGIPADNAPSPVAKQLSESSNAPMADERRVEVRRPLTIGFHVVPLDGRGRPLYTAAFMATGKNISNSGLAVSHLAAMEYPRALISAMGSSSEQFRIEAEVAWTGPTSDGVYETGFRVTRKIVSARFSASTLLCLASVPG